MEQDFLDNFKESWTQQKEDKTYDQQQIFGMLHRKSMNSVKWILVISSIEFIIGLVAAIFYVLPFKSDNIYKKAFGDNYIWFEIFNFISLFITLGFIIYFYRHYKSISVKSSVKSLMRKIYNFRKIAHYYIFYALFILLLSCIYIFTDAGSALVNPNNTELTSSQLMILKITIVVLSLVFFIAYYAIVFGLFLRRLRKNMKHLAKID